MEVYGGLRQTGEHRRNSLNKDRISHNYKQARADKQRSKAITTKTYYRRSKSHVVGAGGPRSCTTGSTGSEPTWAVTEENAQKPHLEKWSLGRGLPPASMSALVSP